MDNLVLKRDSLIKNDDLVTETKRCFRKSSITRLRGSNSRGCFIQKQLRNRLCNRTFYGLGEKITGCDFGSYRPHQLNWLGNVIGSWVLRPDPEKVEAIIIMPDPTDKPGLICLLGMVIYLDNFCKNIAVLTWSLRDVLWSASESSVAFLF
jgi:hypothetical protein